MKMMAADVVTMTTTTTSRNIMCSYLRKKERKKTTMTKGKVRLLRQTKNRTEKKMRSRGNAASRKTNARGSVRVPSKFTFTR